MKRFLQLSLTFCGVLFCLCVGVDFGLSELVMHSNEKELQTWDDLMHKTIDSDLIIMGNSRSWVHYNPEILDSILHVNSYNLGYDGSSLNRQIQRYHIYRKRNRKPKFIVQNIDFFSLQYVVGYQKEQFLPYFLNKDMRKEFYRQEPFNFADKYLPLYRYRGTKIYKILRHHPPLRTKGYQGQDLLWDGELFNSLDSITFCISDTTARMFDDYLKSTQEDTIKTVFVYAPIYSGVISKATNWAKMQDTFQYYADKYGIMVLDYSKLDICRDTAYFYNAMHLNRRGAEIFSDTLARDLKRLGFTNP